MAWKRDKLRYEPRYKPGPPVEQPAKRKRMWRTVVRVLTVGRSGRQPPQDHHRTSFQRAPRPPFFLPANVTKQGFCCIRPEAIGAHGGGDAAGKPETTRIAQERGEGLEWVARKESGHTAGPPQSGPPRGDPPRSELPQGGPQRGNPRQGGPPRG